MPIVALFMCAACARSEPSSSPSAPSDASFAEYTIETEYELKLTIVYDNNGYNPRLETKWEFPCLVRELEKAILFDTGGDSDIMPSITSMHPMREETMVEFLKYAGTGWDTVQDLIENRSLVEPQYQGKKFDIRKLPALSLPCS